MSVVLRLELVLNAPVTLISQSIEAPGKGETAFTDLLTSSLVGCPFLF
jgi:hypothetical protein